jgi:serine protease
MLGFRAPGGRLGALCEDDQDIWSTIWPKSDLDCTGRGEIRGYDTLAGTSMATPFVTGVAALLFSQRLSNQQVVDRLKATSSNHGSWDPVYGYGIVDAGAATGSSAAAAPTTAPAAGALSLLGR